MLNGLNVIRNLSMDESSIYVLGIPIVLTMAVIFLPSKVVSETPQMIQYLLGSPITIAAITAIVINLVMGKHQESKVAETDKELKKTNLSKEELAESK